MKKIFLASSIDRVAGHIAKQLKTKKLKTVFIYTAAEAEGLNKKWLKMDRNGLIKAGFDVFDYTITGKKYSQIVEDLKDVDVIHVNGGNNFYLLLQARKSGFDQLVRDHVNQGKIYIGSSAGSIIAAPDVGISKILDKKSYEKELKNTKAFNIVDFIIMPHWGSESFHKEYRLKRIEAAYKPENKIILLNDYQYVAVKDDGYRIVDIRID